MICSLQTTANPQTSHYVSPRTFPLLFQDLVKWRNPRQSFSPLLCISYYLPSFLQLFSKATGSLLTAIENHLIFLDFSKPFNISDYPLLNNSPVLTWELSQYLLLLFQEAYLISELHVPSPLSQKGGHTQRAVIRPLIYIWSHMVISFMSQCINFSNWVTSAIISFWNFGSMII